MSTVEHTPAPDTGLRLPATSGGWHSLFSFYRQGNQGTGRSGGAGLSLRQIRGPQSPHSHHHPHRLGSGWASMAFWHHMWQIREQTQSRRLINCSYSRPWRPLSFLPICVSPVSLAAPGVLQGLRQHRCKVKSLPTSPPHLPTPGPRGPGPTPVRAREPSN